MLPRRGAILSVVSISTPTIRAKGGRDDWKSALLKALVADIPNYMIAADISTESRSSSHYVCIT